MGKIVVLGGDFQKRESDFNGRELNLYESGRIFKSVSIGMSEISDLELISSGSSKNISGGLLGAAVGAVALGPAGMIGGALLGGNKNEAHFRASLFDGRHVVAKTAADTFSELYALWAKKHSDAPTDSLIMSRGSGSTIAVPGTSVGDIGVGSYAQQHNGFAPEVASDIVRRIRTTQAALLDNVKNLKQAERARLKLQADKRELEVKLQNMEAELEQLESDLEGIDEGISDAQISTDTTIDDLHELATEILNFSSQDKPDDWTVSEVTDLQSQLDGLSTRLRLSFAEITAIQSQYDYKLDPNSASFESDVATMKESIAHSEPHWEAIAEIRKRRIQVGEKLALSLKRLANDID